jgi:hypothetical protein
MVTPEIQKKRMRKLRSVQRIRAMVRKGTYGKPMTSNDEQVLVARRQIRANGMVYNAGAVLPSGLRNERALIATHYAERRTRPTSVVKPVPVPKADKPLARPKIEYVMVENDPVASWKKTRARYIEACGGVVSRADDWLMADSACRDLARQATQIACAKAKEGRKLQSVTPDMIEGF